MGVSSSISALAAYPMAYITRLAKGSMLDVLGQGLCPYNQSKGCVN